VDEPLPAAPPLSDLGRLFLSPADGRLRAGWRVLVHAILAVALLFAFLLPVSIVAAVLMSAFPALDLERALLGMSARRLLDRRSFRSLGLNTDRQALADLIVGFAVAGLVMALVFAAEWAMGWIDVEGWAWESKTAWGSLIGLAGGLVVFIAVGYQEELLSRGYQLQNLIEGTGLRRGLFLSSAAFSVLHLLNPHASLASLLGILAAGYFLAYPWLRTRQLWMSIGLHIGWNFFEGPIFGFPVSGLDIFRLLRHTVTGPELITGGPFGPEAGLIILPGMALGAALIWVYTQGRPTAA
jgi:membrane protease YdiL (CAAX protease family)